MNLLFLAVHCTLFFGIGVGIWFYMATSAVSLEHIALEPNILQESRLKLQDYDSKFNLYSFKGDREQSFMPGEKRPLLISDEVLKQLQQILLKAVLLGHKLPGLNQPTRFPDLHFILRQPTVILLEENLAPSFSSEELPIPIRIVSQESLRQETSQQGEGDVTYLDFQSPKVEKDVVHLTLEAKIYPHNPGQPILGLSSIRVTFQKVSERWQVLGEPIFFSN